MPIYSCRDWLINTDERLLCRNKKVTRLTPRAFDILELLISKRGETVSKDEILGTVWAGYLVEEGNLAVHIFRIRRQLLETPNAPFIETIPGVGYRFVAPVSEEDALTWQLIVHGRPQRVDLTQERNGPNLVVMPFENLTGDPSLDVPLEVLAELLMNALSQFNGFAVMATTPAHEVAAGRTRGEFGGEGLGVEYVVSGRIRRFEKHLQVSFEILNAPRNTRLHGGVLPEFRIMSQLMMESITDSIVFSVVLAVEREGNGSVSIQRECSRLLTSARHLMRRREVSNLEAAVKLLKKAVSLDSNFLVGYIEIVECYILNFVAGYTTRCDVEAQIAPYLDLIAKDHICNDLVLTAIAAKLVFVDFQFEQAKENLLRAVAVNPFNIRARRRLADVHLSLGEFDEAVEQFDRICSIDPDSFRSLVFLGRCHFRMGRFDTALRYLHKALELEPRDFTVYLLIGACFIESGNVEAATAAAERSIELHFHPDAIHLLAYIDALSGQPERALASAARLEKAGSSFQPYFLARIHAAVGDFDRAFELLDVAYEVGDPDLRGLVSDPGLTAFRDEPRFKEFLARFGVSAPSVSRGRPNGDGRRPPRR